jgi:exosortase/archaeosortase family protein
LETSSLLSNWAIALAAVLAVLIGLIAGYGAIGYFAAARRIRQPFLRFLIRYSVVFLLLIGLEIAVAALFPSVHNTLRDATASFVSWILGLAGVSHSVAGPMITVNDPLLTFDVTMACLGGVLFWVYSGLVLAESGITRRQRLIGLAVGLATLVAFNLFRITTSIYLEWRTGVNVHNYFYLFNMVFVLLVWFGWIRTLKPRPAPTGEEAIAEPPTRSGQEN